MLNKESDKIPRYAGYAIHSILRKSLGSTASAVLWNAIEVAPDDVWVSILRVIEDTDGDTLQERVEMMKWYLVDPEVPMPYVTLVRLGFELLHDEEWEILERYCTEYYQAVLKEQADRGE